MLALARTGCDIVPCHHFRPRSLRPTMDSQGELLQEVKDERAHVHILLKWGTPFQVFGRNVRATLLEQCVGVCTGARNRRKELVAGPQMSEENTQHAFRLEAHATRWLG